MVGCIEVGRILTHFYTREGECQFMHSFVEINLNCRFLIIGAGGVYRHVKTAKCLQDEFTNWEEQKSLINHGQKRRKNFYKGRQKTWTLFAIDNYQYTNRLIWRLYEPPGPEGRVGENYDWPIMSGPKVFYLNSSSVTICVVLLLIYNIKYTVWAHLLNASSP